MEVSLELEKQYIHLRNRVFKVAFACQFSKPDAEDLFHDICLKILEQQLDPGAWGGLITKMCGKARNDRYRKRNREVSLVDNIPALNK